MRGGLAAVIVYLIIAVILLAVFSIGFIFFTNVIPINVVANSVILSTTADILHNYAVSINDTNPIAASIITTNFVPQLQNAANVGYSVGSWFLNPVLNFVILAIIFAFIAFSVAQQDIPTSSISRIFGNMFKRTYNYGAAQARAFAQYREKFYRRTTPQQIFQYYKKFIPKRAQEQREKQRKENEYTSKAFS